MRVSSEIVLTAYFEEEYSRLENIRRREELQFHTLDLNKKQTKGLMSGMRSKSSSKTE